jgi:hypothetical protein
VRFPPTLGTVREHEELTPPEPRFVGSTVEGPQLLRVQRNPADRTHRIPKPGWAARRRAYKPADPERESKSERSTLPTPFISHTYTLEPRAQPCGSSLRVAAKKPYHTLNPAVNPLQLPAHRVIVRLHDADTSGAVHTLGLPVATARCQSTLTTRGTRDSGCG